MPTTASRSPSPSRSTKLGDGSEGDADPVERIGAAGQLGEDAAVLLERAQVAVRSRPTTDVHIAVAVDVDEAGRWSVAPTSTPSNGLAAPDSSVKAPPSFSKVRKMPASIADDHIHVAVAIQVDEAGPWQMPPTVQAVERIGGAGQLREGRRHRQRPEFAPSPSVTFSDQRPARRRRVADIGVGQVLDQRVDRRGGCGRH